jgi:2,3,4,5-tetrahydropyridine-2-carboxylate N-succinyltransferase
MELKAKIEAAWNDRALLKEETYSNAVREVIEEVDKGRLRVAAPNGNDWIVNEWVKQAILMYFGIQQMKTWDLAPF